MRAPQPAELVLVRHGRSAHRQRGWVDADGFRQWRMAYEHAGVRSDDVPPPSLQAVASRASLIVSSDAPRAIESAARLRTGVHPASALLRELALDVDDVGTYPLPMALWALRIGVRMAIASRRGAFPPAHERERIVDAADWLDSLSHEHAAIVVVTHAVFRSQLAKACLQRGWRAGGSMRSMSNWSAWRLVRDVSAHHV